ncbi:MAG: adenylyltransferase/sulfurtransferase [Saprospiraceae bacterium]|jgi:adenylyltransferase/sulfurtransferase|tara:strand:- start:239 stop:538 length:300 start_codon:yes stop_codon:yes gene_type:complete
MKAVTVQDVKKMQDEGTDFQFIDVREVLEFEGDNLGAELIVLGTIADNADKISKDKQVVIHCRSGARSGQACMFLEMNFGFDNVYNMTGGILAYRAEIG